MTEEPPRLIVLRGNSGSGKSTVARQLRDRCGRGLAVVGQDAVRRDILREHDIAGAANIGLIDTIARYSLAHGFHTVVEGILTASRYGDMLRSLHEDHADRAFCYYLDVPLAETLRRHATRPQAAEFSERDIRDWYREGDRLPGGIERIVPETSTVRETVERVIADSGLAAGPGATTT
ncbi:AAA family ATPase [Streptomyces sp. NPDC002855]|uniref:AAA family ATPase n=1 Tax=unclassified Streptomyces TaxID=2593676 RepID=UPI00332B52BD